MYNVSPWHKKMWRATGLCCKMSTKKLLDHVDSCYMLLGLQSVDSPTNKNLHIFCFSDASETRCSRVGRHLEVDMASLKFRTPSSWSHWSSQLATSRGNRLSGWGDQTLENPHFFLLWNDCIYSAYKLSPSFFMYLWHFFGTFPHLHQWIIGQFCKELFETTWRWSPLQRGPTKLLMRSRWRETRLLEDLTFNSQFSLTFPKWKKLGKIEKIKRPLK